MKKILALTAAFLCAGLAFSGGVENKTNMSTGYLRNPSRNTETQRPEAAFYNIAGTGFMKNGLYAEFGNQFVFKEYTNSLQGTDYSDTTTVWLYPDFDFVYKSGTFSVFGDFGIYAGGGNLNYDDGVSVIAATFAQAAAQFPAAAPLFAQAAINHAVSVSSITYGGQLGGAYKINSIFSVAAAFRTAYGTQSMELKSDAIQNLNGGNKVSYNADAWGIGGVFGIHAQPVDGLDLSVQYQTITAMEYKISDTKGNLAASFGIADGKKFNTDIPSALNIGAGYQILDPLYVSASFNYYFNKNANQDSVLGKTDYDNSWEIGAGADYVFSNMLTAGLGISYGKQGTNAESNSVFSPVLDSFTVGAGIEFLPVRNLTLTLAGLYSKYFEAEYNGAVKLNKNLCIVSLGVTYRFF